MHKSPLLKSLVKQISFYSSEVMLPSFLCNRKGFSREKVAIIDKSGNNTYGEILDKSNKLSIQVLSGINQHNNKEIHNKVGFLCSNDASYTICQWSIWMSGAVAVPLATSHPLSELQYILEDSQCVMLVSDKQYESKAEQVANKLSIPHVIYEEKGEVDEQSSVSNVVAGVTTGEAMIVYTSGTTGKPKGVVLTFSNLQAQRDMLEEAWGVTECDVFLNMLPLHHVHGIMNALLLPLSIGATVHMLPKFSAKQVWECLLGDNKINVLNAVPTIYYKLIEHYKEFYKTEEEKASIHNLLNKKMRVMISGSAPLPQPILSTWKDISSHTLLERYGMTEIGMALSNPLHATRIPGAVGLPLPTVEARIVCSSTQQCLVEGDSNQVTINKNNNEELIGDLQIKGPSLFKEYINKPEATKESFTQDGWFITGDVASFSETDNAFRILGRASVDIIKSGGYKISALDIERHLLSHPIIQEVAVLGIPDEQWGQVIFALLVTKDNMQLNLLDVKRFAQTVMPSYQIPKEILVVDEIPRNAMGKVNKKQLLKDYAEKL